jgi:hypothetical protein
LSAGAVVKEDTGLGTTYERWSLNRVLQHIHKQTGLRSVFEGPGDGMTGISGINSLILGRDGAQVSLLLPQADRAAFAQEVWSMHAPAAALRVLTEWDGVTLPFEDDAFDLAWNFNVIQRARDPAAMLDELCRISRQWVLACVPNRCNYGFLLHRLHHRIAKEPWDHGRIDLMQPKVWRRWFAERGWRVREIIWLDCPWWPDIVDAGQMLADFFPFMRRWAHRARPARHFRWSAAALPYYEPDTYAEIHQRMNRLAGFENSRLGFVRRSFAHHVGVLAERE